MIRTPGELRKIMASVPFSGEKNYDPSNTACIFLREKPTGDQEEKVKEVNYTPDKFIISGNEIFIYCPNGFGRTKLYTSFFENRMKVVGIVRNLNTIKALIDIAGGNQDEKPGNDKI